MRITVTGSLVFWLILAGAAAVDWNTNLPSFQGGPYDGWDRQGMISAAGLSDTQITFSSATNQVLVWTHPQGVLTTLTIRVVNPGSPIAITNGGTLRVSLLSGWACRFNTGATLSFASNAAAKINASVSYADGDRTLVVPVTADFLADDTLTISGLTLLDLALCRAGLQYLELDFDGDGTPDTYDAFALELSVPQPGGSFDGWGRSTQNAYTLYRMQGTMLTIR
ncbi:MAG: hypothetical protein A2340_08930 [Lentisphaerae bacterium RIFOXYB12_FULL_60_10]|nr:MAG: hypothetical protein A2340_08930 [Lentisphaerae bacterium RIFOXYB12_FULL_60_10]